MKKLFVFLRLEAFCAPSHWQSRQVRFRIEGASVAEANGWYREDPTMYVQDFRLKAAATRWKGLKKRRNSGLKNEEGESPVLASIRSRAVFLCSRRLEALTF